MLKRESMILKRLTTTVHEKNKITRI